MKPCCPIHYTSLLLLLLIWSSCSKDPAPEKREYSPIPHIRLMAVNPMTVTEFEDSILFTIAYRDGDGDIGFENADSTALHLIDNRGPLVEEYHIPPLTPDGAELTIQGTLRITLNNVFLLEEKNETEITTFTLKLRDRAGNWSNVVTSDTVVITK